MRVAREAAEKAAQLEEKMEQAGASQSKTDQQMTKLKQLVFKSRKDVDEKKQKIQDLTDEHERLLAKVQCCVCVCVCVGVYSRCVQSVCVCVCVCVCGTGGMLMMLE